MLRRGGSFWDVTESVGTGQHTGLRERPLTLDNFQGLSQNINANGKQTFFVVVHLDAASC